jgi:hypothetical protein
MSIATFNEFLKTIDPKSEGFIELARSVSSGPDLADYAQKHGIELSTEEAAEVIESGKREAEAAGISPLSEDALENVNGGSWQLTLGLVGAGIGLMAAAVIVGPLVGAVGVVGYAASMTVGTAAAVSGAMGAAGAGVGLMVGGLTDLIAGKDNN